MGKIDKKEVDKKDGEKTLQSPEQICDHLRVTYVPAYLLAKAALRQLEHELTYCTIQAPISGVVTQLTAVMSVYWQSDEVKNVINKYSIKRE